MGNPNANLVCAFQYWRKPYVTRYGSVLQREAHWTAQLARLDVANGTRRYVSGTYATRFNAPKTETKETLQFFENLASVPFRFVGFADEIAKSDYRYACGIRHKGWHTDDFCEETLRGCVFRLSHGRGFLIGYQESANDGFVVSLESIFPAGKEDNEQEKRDAAYAADSFAERAAEKEREYQEASNARFEYDELENELIDTSKGILTLQKLIAAEQKALSDIVAKREKLQNAFGSHQAWKDN
jgi:hypothetical protein